MVLAGARRQTAKQLCDALHVTEEQSHRRHFSKFLTEQLPGYAPDVILHVANRMYCEREFPVLKEFLDLLEECYATSIESVDFRNNAEKVSLEINAWVEQVTASKIKDLLPSGILTSATIFVLVNAIYFKGLWQDPFNTFSTHSHEFYVHSKSKKTVEMMFQENDYCLAKSEKLKATVLEIPYKGLKTSMVVLLPDDIDGLSFLEENLTADSLSAVIRDLVHPINVKLYLPKFKLEQSITLNDTLQCLGISDMFSANSDLSGVCETGKLTVTAVLHKAFVEVNEEGTEAAAATAIITTECCIMPLVTHEFVVDHPFMFLIRCHDPDLVLFMGSVRYL
ncbi:hypothetical protein V5799_026314 [Amblyomma americanum]|uniref:Serpin domain-containing protein n=1 Tax=Amblyomma americanum TaxID=6943 RepID=A0AAQ4DIY3_AMBAM